MNKTVTLPRKMADQKNRIIRIDLSFNKSINAAKAADCLDSFNPSAEADGNEICFRYEERNFCRNKDQRDTEL